MIYLKNWTKDIPVLTVSRVFRESKSYLYWFVSSEFEKLEVNSNLYHDHADCATVMLRCAADPIHGICSDMDINSCYPRYYGHQNHTKNTLYEAEYSASISVLLEDPKISSFIHMCGLMAVVDQFISRIAPQLPDQPGCSKFEYLLRNSFLLKVHNGKI